MEIEFNIVTSGTDIRRHKLLSFEAKILGTDRVFYRRIQNISVEYEVEKGFHIDEKLTHDILTKKDGLTLDQDPILLFNDFKDFIYENTDGTEKIDYYGLNDEQSYNFFNKYKIKNILRNKRPNDFLEERVSLCNNDSDKIKEVLKTLDFTNYRFWRNRSNSGWEIMIGESAGIVSPLNRNTKLKLEI